LRGAGCRKHLDGDSAGLDDLTAGAGPKREDGRQRRAQFDESVGGAQKRYRLTPISPEAFGGPFYALDELARWLPGRC